MSIPTISVNLELNQIVAGEFVVGSSLVGGSDVIGDGLSDVASEGVRCSIRRGRWGALYEDFEAGVISVTFNNEDRLFDPVYASGDYFGELVPGRDVNIQANGITIVTGFVEDFDLEYDVSGRSVTVVRATDALGRMGSIQFNEWTNSANTATAKLDAICNRPEVAWSSALRDFIEAQVEVGLVLAPSLQSDAVSWGSNCLSYMKLVAQSAWFSWLFASADGAITLRPLNSYATYGYTSPPYPGTAVAAFGGADLPYQSIRAQYGSESMFAEVSVDFEGGSAQTATVADLAAWQTTYGPPRRLSVPQLLLGTRVFDDGAGGTITVTGADQALQLAEDLLAYYDAPTYRITELSVELAALDSTDQDTVLSIDISNAVDVTFTPNGVGSAVEQTLVVQGIAHEITPESHVVTFALIDYLAA